MPSQQYLPIRIYPNARRCEIRSIREDGVICIGVQAPPVDGKANAALREFIAAQLGVKKRFVTIARGEKSRTKMVSIDHQAGITIQQALACLAALAPAKKS